jgi:sugar-specific transcriptional regulator TrmB
MELLEQVGFTEYETKVYKALLQLGSGTATSIARVSNVPTNKVYESLISLIEQGFVASLDVRPKQYKITGVQRFHDFVENEKGKIKDMQKAITLLENTIKKKKKDETTALVLKGKKQMMHLLTEATKSACSFTYSFVGHLSFDYRSAKSVKDAVCRGVDIRFLVHKHPKHKTIVKKWEKLGVKVRFYPKDEQKSIRFSTIDSRVCRFTIGEPEIVCVEDYISFWVESPAFASLLKDQFLTMWKKAKK